MSRESLVQDGGLSTLDRTDHRAPVDTADRARLVDAYSPGAQVLRARRLRGGLGASTQVLDVEHGDGRREKVVLRVYLPGRESLTPERARREFRTIELVQAAGVPSAQPLFLDADATFLGEPSMLLSYLPGRSMYRQQDTGTWTAGLASAMRSIHAVTPEQYDLSWLPRFGLEEIAADLDKLRPEVLDHEDDIARDTLRALDASMSAVDWLPPCLVHEDFWPGNTVWYRGKLAGVIDWANAKVGDARLDLAQCRVDVLLVCGIEVADALADAYAVAAGEAVRDLWFFDLLIGVRALLEYKVWLIGYHDAGLTFVTEERARERIHTFLTRAIAASKRTS